MNVLDGRSYNRGVRLSKVVYEALIRLAWRGFLPWFQEHHIDDMPLLPNTIDPVTRLDDNITQQEHEAAIQDPSCCNILELFSVTAAVHKQHSGCLTWTWWKYFLLLSVHLERETGYYT